MEAAAPPVLAAAEPAPALPGTPKQCVVRLLTERGTNETPEQLLAQKLPALIRRAMASGVDGDLLGDALKGRSALAIDLASPDEALEPDVPVSCAHCSATVLHKLLEDHDEVCPLRPVGCINAQWGCDAVMPRFKRGGHLARCPASVVVCAGEPSVPGASPQLPLSWAGGCEDESRSDTESHCRWLGKGQAICGAVVRRDQWEQHVQLSHVLLPLDRTDYQFSAGSRPGEPGWYCQLQRKCQLCFEFSIENAEIMDNNP